MKTSLSFGSDLEEISSVERFIDSVCADYNISEEVYGNILIATIEAVKNAIIYVKGDKVDIVEKNAEARLDEAMSKLVAKVYNKLGYMTFAPDKSDILAVLNSKSQEGFQTAENESQLALDSINDYVNDQDFVHTTPSLKVILDRFSSAPYGFHDLDIQWLVAKLFVDKNISLTINNEDISIKKEGSQKVLDYLTRGEYREKVLLGIKEIVSPINIKDAKEVLKDLFDYSIASDDSEKIMDEILKNVVEAYESLEHV